MRLVALWLCGICIAMFVLQGFVGTETVILDRSVMWQEPWRIVTSLFAHANMSHLLANLFALGLFGLILEGRIGPKRVLWLFLISGLVINLFTPYPRSLGASGAIFAILGALVVLRPFMTVWVSGMPMPMIVAGLVWLFQDIAGMFVPSGIGHLAHIGGLVIGVIMGFYWFKRFGDRLGRKRRDFNPEVEEELDRWEQKHNLR